MTDENNVADISNTAEGVDLDTTEENVDSTETTEESIDDVKSRLEQAEKQLAQEKKARKDTEQRAEIAERKAKVTVKTDSKPDISFKDQMAFINAKVHEDDIDEVIDYANFKKISIPEALKSNVIKSSLSDKEELRNTADATNTGRTRSGNSKQSGDTLLNKAKKTGELPDRDEDLETLLEARYTKKK